MKFRDDHQRCAAIVTLLTVAGTGEIWTLRGPALEARRRRGVEGGLATDDRVLLSIAWSIWDGSVRVRFTDLHRLCARCFEAATTLLESEGPAAVDRWIGDHTRPEHRCLQRVPSQPRAETLRVASWRSHGSWL